MKTETNIFPKKSGKICLSTGRLILLLAILPLCKVAAQDSAAAVNVNSRQLFDIQLSDSVLAKHLEKFGRTLESDLDILASYKKPNPVVPAEFQKSSEFITPGNLAKTKAPQKRVVAFSQGYLSYNANYRSGLDSFISESNLFQHLIQANASFVVAEKLPIRVKYNGRESNSAYFKSYHDFGVELDIQEYQQMRRRHSLNEMRKQLSETRQPVTRFSDLMVASRLSDFQRILNSETVLKRLIESKEVLLRKTFADTSMSYRDSMITSATNFITFYDCLQIFKQKYQRLFDSIQNVKRSIEGRMKVFQQLAAKGNLSTREIEQLAGAYGQNDDGTAKLMNRVGGVRSLALGRSYPDYSALTVQNVNITGFNIEYEKKNIYLAAAAGSVDFRVRDFLFSDIGHLPKQYVCIGRVGYGSKEADHVVISFFRGKKQLFGSFISDNASTVQGVSVATQKYFNRHTKLSLEIAHSQVAEERPAAEPKKPFFDLNDHSRQAFIVRLSSDVRRTQTQIEGHFQKLGLNYQAFNSFQYSAASNSWSLRIRQNLWKRRISILAAVRKNDFFNPQVLDRYSANTVFKSATISFQRTGWPTVSAGYLPTSQYTVIANRVYENHFQSLMGNVNYQYSMGEAKGVTALSFIRFYNDSRDSGFVYFNSKNLLFNQAFQFAGYTGRVGAAIMINNNYRLDVLEAGMNTSVFGGTQLDLTLKVTNLNHSTSRVGFRTGGRISVRSIGDLNIWTERSYLPTSRNNLYKYEVYNFGLTRYFK